MIKEELINKISYRSGVSKIESKKVIDLFIDEIRRSLINGEKVTLSGLATFEVIYRGERKGRNPKTNEVVTFPSSKIVRCRPSKTLKDTVSGKIKE